MVRVVAAHGDVQRRSQGLRQRSEKMRDQFGGQFPNPLTIEFPVPHEVGPPAKIEGDLRFRLVHRQQEPVACNAPLVAQRSGERGAEDYECRSAGPTPMAPAR